MVWSNSRLCNWIVPLMIFVTTSVTRLGNLFHFVQLFKACGNNYFAQISHIFRQFLLSYWNISFCQCNQSFLGNFYRHLAGYHFIISDDIIDRSLSNERSPLRTIENKTCFRSKPDRGWDWRHDWRRRRGRKREHQFPGIRQPHDEKTGRIYF